MSSIRRIAPVALLVLAVLVSVPQTAWAKVAVLWLRDRTDPIKGELVAETPETVTIKIAGIATPIDRDRIDRIDYELSVPDQYAQKRSRIDDSNHEARYELIYWLYSHASPSTYRLAQGELKKLLADDPDHTRAKLLLDLTEQKLRAIAEASPDQRDAGDAATDGGPTPTGAGRDAPPTLTEKQRDLIKVYEVEPGDRPRVVIPDDIVNEFLEKYRTDPAVADYVGREGERRFKRLAGYEQLNVLFDARAREYYDDVVIRDEPRPLTELRQQFGPTLISRYCGSCHGGGTIEGPYIFTRRPNSEEIAYTNFFILNEIQGGQRHMIDRTIPKESLLLQYALPRADATYLHPEVDGMQPYFTGYNDPRYDRAVQWIQALLPSNTSYPIDYRPPQTPVTPVTPAEEADGEAPADGNSSN